jgi:hypothetical protein
VTLTEFLLARFAEDETQVVAHRIDCHFLASDTFGECDCGQPARVLAECEANQRIVQWHALVVGEDQGGTPVMGCANCIGAEAGQTFTIEGPCMTLRLLALPYADHPDFREEWRP